MTNELQDFEQFMQDREQVASSYVRGDADPLMGIVTHELPATFFGPGGGHTKGAQEVATAYQQGAASFEPDGESQLEILHTAASHGIAYWVGFQRAKVRLKGKAEAIPMDLRITEVFRREGEQWRMVHRHADTLVEPQHAK